MEAQRYPTDYNGMVSGSPAINWGDFIPAEIWPQVVMRAANDFLPACKEQAFTAAQINACDANDGITDGVISDPAHCHWNPDQLVGRQTPCGTITRTDAEVVKKILQGPVTRTGQSLWFGLEPGAGMTTLAGTTTDASGVTTADPQFLTLIYLDPWLHPDDPSWTWQELTYANFQQLFQQSVATFDNVIGTRNPDLSAFKAHGGKILIWHGLADPLISPRAPSITTSGSSR